MPALAHVVSVQADGSTVTVWTFDRPVVAIDDATGLKCPGSGDSVTASVSGTYTVDVEFELPVDGGVSSPWECVAANVTMTFGDGGATLQDGSGLVS